jgi:hypothetical protein
MKKGIKIGLVLVSLVFALIFVSSLASATLEIANKTDLGSVVIAELNNPAIFNFKVFNPTSPDAFEIYSFTGVKFSPVGTFGLPAGWSTFEVRAYPSKDVRKTDGYYNFQYEIKGENNGITKDMMMIKIAHLDNILDISAMPLYPSSDSATITIKNKENTNLEDLNIGLESEFFNTEQDISMKPYEEITFNVSVDKSKTARLFAGKYIIDATLDLDGAKAKAQGIIDYLEENGLSVDKMSSGVIMRKNSITKTNVGNVATKAQIDFSRNILSRLFTVYSIQPQVSARKGLSVNYLWEKTLNPGESYSISATTNYTLPLVILVLIILVVVLVKIYSAQTVSVAKRVSFVRTKSGIFALKVTLHVKAKKHTDDIQVIDRLPSMMTLYEQYGRMPDNIDHSTKRLFWNIPRLNPGEERVFSYVIYSKLNVVGRVELPSATAVFEQDGKEIEAFSNKAYFAVSTAVRRDE